MNQLIKLATAAIGAETVQTVNARDLHAFLTSKQQFADWIKARVDQYEFQEDLDFTVHKVMNGRATQIDYHLTLAMAKELAMVERTDKGKQARQYFIECERRAHIPALSPANMSRLQLLEMAMQAEQERLVLEKTVAVLEVKSDRLDRIEQMDGSFCITDTAKLLQLQPKKLFGWMQSNDWIYRRTGGPGWLGYQDKLKSGVLEHKITTVTRGDGTEKVTEQVRVTAKGLVALTAKIQEDPKKFGPDAVNPQLPGIH